MNKELNLHRVLILDENKINPMCHVCSKETTAFLISQEELINYFSPEDIGYLTQKNYIRQSKDYKPKLILFLCRICCKEKEK